MQTVGPDDDVEDDLPRAIHELGDDDHDHVVAAGTAGAGSPRSVSAP